MLCVVFATGDCGDVVLVVGHWWLGMLVAGHHDWWWWLKKRSVWLVDDAKSNVGKRRRSFRKVGAKLTYI